jgi:multisubunit Na+/H+ antiporter MnhG subunit
VESIMMIVKFAVLQGQWIVVVGLLGILLAEALYRLGRA